MARQVKPAPDCAWYRFTSR